MREDKSWWIVWLVIALCFAAIWPYRGLPAHWAAIRKMDRPLRSAKSWHYQLDKVDVEQLARTPGDLLVIDYARHEGKLPLSAAEVERLKTGPDGRRRFVVSYLSVGESEEFRFYWQDIWKQAPPDWLGEENCAWPRARRVRYWMPGWKQINFASADSYLRRIIEAGFDGVYLDRVDIYETFEKERPSARQEMIEHVAALAATARRLKPGFFIIPQNAEALLRDPSYRAAIDGLGKESLLNSGTATGVRNKPAEIRASVSDLERLIDDGKPVFAVEYLVNVAQMANADDELRALHIVPTFETRALDGGDPAVPIDLASEIGTPERTAKDCPPGTSW
jgi:cysteinyl-tRNA synthetase